MKKYITLPLNRCFEKGMIFKDNLFDIEPQNYTDSILSAAVKIIMVSVTTIELNQSAVEKHLLATTPNSEMGAFIQILLQFKEILKL